MGHCCVYYKNNTPETTTVTERNIILDLKKQQRNEYTKKIKQFINKNIENLKKKESFIKKTSKSLYTKQITDPFFENNYYQQKFISKLKNIKNDKKKFFKELFPDEKALTLNSLDHLKEILANYYNDDIYDNKINFYKNFVMSIQETEKVKKAYVKKAPRKSLNTNFLNFMAKNSAGSLFENPTVFSGFGALNFGDINLSKEQKYIRKDIEVLFKYCFNIEKLPKFEICKKRSKILSLIDDNKKFKQLNISNEFRHFIKTLYYIILLKKLNCLSDTGHNKFYKINKKHKNNINNISNQNIDFSDCSEEDVLSKQLQKDKINIQIPKKKANLKVRSRNRSNFLGTQNSGRMSVMVSKLNTEFSSNNDNSNANTLRATGAFNIGNSKFTSLNTTNTLNMFNSKQVSQEIPKQVTQEIPLISRRKGNKRAIGTVIERNPPLDFKNIKTLDKHAKFYSKLAKKTDEEFYSGQYDNTNYLYAGLGTLIEPDKNTCYTGTFRYGVKDGMGIFYEELPNDNMLIYFIGEFRNNKIKGFGEKINIKKNIFIFKKGLFNEHIFLQGKIKIIKENILKDEIDLINYDGDISRDLFDGFGTLNQKTYGLSEFKTYEFLYEKDYKGEFKNGKENGKGIMRFNSGINQDSYEYSGNFINGLRDGYGVIKYAENYFIQKYEGFFREDKPFTTYGIVYFKSGDTYEGFFNDDYKKDYAGTYSFYDPISKTINESYFGGFLKDSKHGLGKIYYHNSEECRMLNGNFNMGDKQGFFEMNEYKSELIIDKVNDNNKKKRRLTSYNYGDLYEKKIQRNQNKQYILFEQNEIMEKNDISFY